MALFSQAALLDELFGSDRNSTVKIEIKWDDDSICKYYLAGFCPHDLFVNTKISLGQCPNVHDAKLLDKYKNSPQFLKMGYERKLIQFLQRYVDDVKKKIVFNVERLENGLLSGTEVGIQKRITLFESEINELVKRIEDYGNEGRIEECRNLNIELEEKQKILKYDRIELETQRRSTRERLEEVCNICGAYISKNDPRNSLENHVSGRIHCSYVKLNEVLSEMNEIMKNSERNPEARTSVSDRRSDYTSRYRDHDRDSIKYRNRDHDREHDRYKDRSRDRGHDQSKYASRDEERTRYNGDSREKDYNNVRSRDKRHEGDHGRSRDRERSRKRDSIKRHKDKSIDDDNIRKDVKRSKNESGSPKRSERNMKEKFEDAKEKSWGEI